MERARCVAGHSPWDVEAGFERIEVPSVFYLSPDQESAASASKGKAQEHFRRPVVTEIVPASRFYRAAEYHQRYLEKHGRTHCSL